MAFAFSPMPTQTYGPVSRCIYCDATSPPLSDEHIIPFGLGGRILLQAASCGRCAAATSQVEHRLLRSPNWWPLRRALELASRRPKQQPSSFEATVTAAGESETIELTIERYPLLVVVFEFDPPAYRTGQPYPVGAVARRIFGWPVRALQLADGFEVRLREGLIAPTANVEIPVQMTADDLARFLAKIGYGWAIAQHGLDAFEEIYVRELILGDTSEANRWVGGATVVPNFDSRSLHVLADTVIDREVIVYVQLFHAPPGWDQPPVYQVVVGRLRLRDDAE